MLEFDEWDKHLTNGFTALTHREGLRDHSITDAHNSVDLSEALNSHPLHNPSTGKDDGGMKTMMGVTRPRLSHITRTLSEEDPDSPTGSAIETPDGADSSDCDIHDILHTVCHSPHLEYVIS